MKTPIIFIIFNRPSTTQKVFDSIRDIRPEKLYIIADGPRTNKPDDPTLCQQCRKIVDQIDWPCKLIKDFSNTNQGCKNRISSGLTRAFKIFDYAIILEDDCLPNHSFFKFCEDMLEKYKNNKQIMSITGNNFLFKKQNIIQNSYYFSQYPNIWGWATWKRAWKLYDKEMKDWPKIKKQNVFNKTWINVFNKAYQQKIDTWDIQWTYSNLINKGLTVVPEKNMVSNIGFSPKATHTHFHTIVANMPTEELNFPLKHPIRIIPNYIADKYSRFHFTRLGIIIDFIKQFCQKNLSFPS